MSLATNSNSKYNFNVGGVMFGGGEKILNAPLHAILYMRNFPERFNTILHKKTLTIQHTEFAVSPLTFFVAPLPIF